ncbi:FAD:protein FMN transferase [Streptococcus parauberis]|uniref:FAD:protein FMN transferase n=1 Tax=Streptococcus parauberis TaxID=1348 RepID=UPI000976AE30|nr:FAD:protein FMN transferase [Streptococcus parauberis]ONH63306.1 Thiamine biosynthesis lipoprotein ApbE precursor [Streptococcus parauberis]PCH11639.1 Thiamine biosynthesis lipoprotein ApbE precursor [Streptococcus parauberis]RFE02141.1 Thiamine biosynthesis lipoprotein ApbE precursor [Streptococcus parauberis]
MIAKEKLRMMGTIIDIEINSQNADQQMVTVCQLLETYKNRFSANDDDSELMAINHAAGKEPVSVHPDLYELIEIGKENSFGDSNNLNIAIGPLVQTWRIGFSDANLPEDDNIQEVLALTNPNNIQLFPKTKSVFLTKEGMKIDLGALAKGYIADKIMNFLIEDGIYSALLNLGGNVLVHGKNKNRPDGRFYIGIQNPGKKRGVNLGIVKIENQSVVTSGVYERHLTVNDKDYHHIFDRETGYPIETDMASLTIIAEKSLDCEIWTTRLFGLNPMQAFHIINGLSGVEGIIITTHGTLAKTDGLKSNFHYLY